MLWAYLQWVEDLQYQQMLKREGSEDVNLSLVEELKMGHTLREDPVISTTLNHPESDDQDSAPEGCGVHGGAMSSIRGT